MKYEVVSKNMENKVSINHYGNIFKNDDDSECKFIHKKTDCMCEWFLTLKEDKIFRNEMDMYVASSYFVNIVQYHIRIFQQRTRNLHSEGWCY